MGALFARSRSAASVARACQACYFRTMPGRSHEDDELGVAERSKTEKKLANPRLWKVFLHNDDFTTMEFVVEVLQTVFHKDKAEAETLMLRVHHQGIAQVGAYPHALAQTKVERVHELAEREGFPLLCTMEPE